MPGSYIRIMESFYALFKPPIGILFDSLTNKKFGSVTHHRLHHDDDDTAL